DLPRKIEDDVPIANERIHRRLLPDVGHVDVHSIGDAVDVEQVSAVIGNEGIDEQHVGAEGDEAPRKIAPDESETAGNHDGPAAVEQLVVHVRGAANLD